MTVWMSKASSAVQCGVFYPGILEDATLIFRATASPCQLIQSSVTGCSAGCASELCLELGLLCIQSCLSSHHQHVHWGGAAPPDIDNCYQHVNSTWKDWSQNPHDLHLTRCGQVFCLDDGTEFMIPVFFTLRQIAILSSRPICCECGW